MALFEDDKITQLRKRIAADLGISEAEVPEEAIEQGTFGPMVSQDVMNEIRNKKQEELRSLNALKRQAEVTGLSKTAGQAPIIPTQEPAETKPVQPKIVEIDPGTTIKQAASAAVAPTTEQNADKKADEILTRSQEFEKRRQEYLDVTPAGVLSKKQVDAINERYAPTKEDIEKKLAEAKEEFQAGRNRLQNAELIDTLGKGLVQLMAGIYGVNTGRDAVSGVDFRPKDWSNNLALLQRQYNQQYDELKDLRRETEAARKEEISTAERQAEKTAAQTTRAGTLALGEMKEERRVSEAEKKAEQRELGAEQKRIDTERKDLQKKLDAAKQALGQLKEAPDRKSRRVLEEKLSGALEKLPNVDTSEVQKALKSYEPGGIFSNPDYSGLENIIKEYQQEAAPQQRQQKPQAGMIDMVAPDGRKLKVPSDKVQEMESHGARRI